MTSDPRRWAALTAASPNVRRAVAYALAGELPADRVHLLDLEELTLARLLDVEVGSALDELPRALLNLVDPDHVHPDTIANLRRLAGPIRTGPRTMPDNPAADAPITEAPVTLALLDGNIDRAVPAAAATEAINTGQARTYLEVDAARVRDALALELDRLPGVTPAVVGRQRIGDVLAINITLLELDRRGPADTLVLSHVGNVYLGALYEHRLPLTTGLATLAVAAVELIRADYAQPGAR